MEGGAGSGASRPEQRQEEDGAHNATASSDGSAPPRRRSGKEFTREEWSAAMAFIDAVIADYKAVYADKTEDEVREEYRRAGKLHRYLPDIQLYKSYPRIAKKMPPPAGFLPEKDKYLKLIEDEE